LIVFEEFDFQPFSTTVDLQALAAPQNSLYLN
jgi:hypothetical protein